MEPKLPFVPKIANGITTGSGVAKGVLDALAVCTCRYCGLAWPGMDHLVSHAEYGERAIEGALKRLASMGFLRIWAYGQGGRRKATIYHVLPNHIAYTHQPACTIHCQVELAKSSAGFSRTKQNSAPPAGFVKENPAPPAGYQEENPAPPAGYHEKPRSKIPETPQQMRPIYQDLDLPVGGESPSAPQSVIPPDTPAELRQVFERMGSRIAEREASEDS